jgi:hypothetical protein
MTEIQPPPERDDDAGDHSYSIALEDCKPAPRNEPRVARVIFSELFTDAAWSRSRAGPLLFESPDCVSFQFDATLKANVPIDEHSFGLHVTASIKLT